MYTLFYRHYYSQSIFSSKFVKLLLTSIVTLVSVDEVTLTCVELIASGNLVLIEGDVASAVAGVASSAGVLAASVALVANPF